MTLWSIAKCEHVLFRFDWWTSNNCVHHIGAHCRQLTVNCSGASLWGSDKADRKTLLDSTWEQLVSLVWQTSKWGDMCVLHHWSCFRSSTHAMSHKAATDTWQTTWFAVHCFVSITCMWSAVSMSMISCIFSIIMFSFCNLCCHWECLRTLLDKQQCAHDLWFDSFTALKDQVCTLMLVLIKIYLIVASLPSPLKLMCNNQWFQDDNHFVIIRFSSTKL